MTNTPVTDAPDVALAAGEAADPRHDATLSWLQGEFPAWSFDVDTATSWHGHPKTLWVARQQGHHQQASLTPGGLHTRLDEYLQRLSRRGVASN